ncbi:MAG: PD-(D/E)XK nuclease family protein [Eggerthellales bacterium]|nr:PD-(D/E)XK nuclease family protein [Eggerthellales bacterium]
MLSQRVVVLLPTPQQAFYQRKLVTMLKSRAGFDAQGADAQGASPWSADVRGASPWEADAADADCRMAGGFQGKFPVPMDTRGVRWLGSRIAREVPSMMNAHFLTPSQWTRDLWAVWGDGRILVDRGKRDLLVNQILADQDVLAASPGTALMIAAYLERVSGNRVFQAAVDNPELVADRLAPAELEVLKVAGLYYAALDQYGLIEPGHALMRIAAQMPETTVVLAGAHSLSPAMREFLSSERVRLKEIAYPMPRIGAPEAGVRVSVELPAGPSALARVVRDLVAGYAAGQASVMVLSPDPMGLYRRMALDLQNLGIHAATSFRTEFKLTDFGKVFSAARKICTGPLPGTLEAVADYAASPYSGMSQSEALYLDRMIRSDRTIQKDPGRLLPILREQSPNMEYFEQFFEDPDAGIGCGFFADLARRAYRHDPMKMSVELSAIQALRDLYDSTREYALSPEQFIFATETLIVYGECVEREAEIDVEFVRLDKNLFIDQGSVDHVILTELTAESFPASVEHTAMDTLSEKLGVAFERDVLKDYRLMLQTAVLAAKGSLDIVVPAKDPDGEDSYASFFLDEFLNAYRVDEEDGQKAPLGIPDLLRCGMGPQVGEEQLAANAGQSCRPKKVAASEPGILRCARDADLLSYVEVDGVTYPVLSPSQIEGYISCPYKWFVERKLNPGSMDAQMGPIERGEFVHAVFERTYSLLREDGCMRVTPDNLDQAQEILEDVFEDLMLEQQAGGYIPVTNSEQRDAELLRDTLLQNLAVQAELFAGMEVQGLERVVEPQDGVVFAGACLVGKIDRIDVDPVSGRFAIVDYKGSLKGRHAGSEGAYQQVEVFSEYADDQEGDEPAAPIEEWRMVLPGKVQALLYAVCAQRLGYGTPAAAAYLNYQAQDVKDALAGSFDMEVKKAMPQAIDQKSVVGMDFEAFLSDLEQALVPVVKRMQEGDISPRPKDADQCTYCVVPNCPRRNA